MPRQTSILFVCTGNICRSPTAEAVAKAMAERTGKELVLDSAGTGDWHLGDARTRAPSRPPRRGAMICPASPPAP